MGDQVEQEEEFYYPQDAIAKFTSNAVAVGAAGLLISAVQNTLYKQNVGAMGIFTRFGGTTAWFASVGGAYGFASAATANLREKNDPWNEVTAGFVGGAVAGLRTRTMTSVLGGGLTLAAILGVMAYTQDSITRGHDEAHEDREAKKEEARKRFRRPLNELVNEIGEGRGIYPPGYDERRKQRIKERYGIEIQEPYYKRTPAND